MDFTNDSGVFCPIIRSTCMANACVMFRDGDCSIAATPAAVAEAAELLGDWLEAVHGGLISIDDKIGEMAED